MDPLLIISGVGLFLAGVVFAVYIALFPLPARFTWFGVVVGVGVTNAWISYALLQVGSDWNSVMVVWGGYVITGVPMIALQVSKHYRDAQEANMLITTLSTLDQVNGQ